jgi:hypothetical protein
MPINGTISDLNLDLWRQNLRQDHGGFTTLVTSQTPLADAALVTLDPPRWRTAFTFFV